MFLPPNTSLIQPMDQSIIATFKSYYLKRVMKSMVKAINNSFQNLNSRITLQKFWKNFSIFDSIGFVKGAWEEIKESSLNKCWSKLLPDAIKATQTYSQETIKVHTKSTSFRSRNRRRRV